jgi:acyl carrier protein
MTTIHDTLALADPKFGQIPYLEAQEAVKQEGTTDVAKLLQLATTIEEVHDIVVHAICERFALFSARSIEDVSPSASPEEFGLDSLVALELKNWLVRTFQVQVQTSEVADAASISSLGKSLLRDLSLYQQILEGWKKLQDQPTTV